MTSSCLQGSGVASLKTLEAFLHEKLGWLEKPVSVDEMVDLLHLPR